VESATFFGRLVHKNKSLTSDWDAWKPGPVIMWAYADELFPALDMQFLVAGFVREHPWFSNQLNFCFAAPGNLLRGRLSNHSIKQDPEKSDVGGPLNAQRGPNFLRAMI
jgi:hypothetical protein